MASVSYWFLSPTVVLALLGKLKGADRTRPTPNFDWTKASVDVLIPAFNEEATIALCLASLFEQDLAVRQVTVIDDASTDRTAQVVRRFCEISGRQVELVRRETTAGKTAALREVSRSTDTDAVIVLDADTILRERHHLSRLVEELFRNAGTASACGEVMPLTRRRRRSMEKADARLATLAREFGSGAASGGPLPALLEFFTVIYRIALYTFLQRFLYDGHLKFCGTRLNPIGCAVAYRSARLREVFDYATPLLGDNLSNSEDVFIGHFFAWKGYKNVPVTGVRCESVEPGIFRLPRQLYLWSSSFLQAQYYFKDLPLSVFKPLKNAVTGLFGPSRSRAANGADRRRVREQYRLPWGEQHTRRDGRRAGWVDLLSVFEKVSYPLVLIYLAIFHPLAAVFTIALDAALSTLTVFALAESGDRFRSAACMVAATPVRVLSLAVDLIAVGKYLLDLGTGNRNWRK